MQLMALSVFDLPSPHPVGFKDDLIECYKRLPKLCEYLHFPMQSGSNRILKAMRRPYSIEKFCDIIHKLRSLKTGYLYFYRYYCWLPGETDEDFEATRSVFESLKFDMAYIFKYSVRPGTKCRTLWGSYFKRAQRKTQSNLLDILSASSLARNQSLIGTEQEVLDRKSCQTGEGIFVGRTRGYRKVILPASERLIGELVSVKIKEATTSTLTGELIIRD